MPFSQYAEDWILNSIFGSGTPTALYGGLVLQAGQLSASLAAGATVTSLACGASTLAYGVALNDIILLGSNTQSQYFTTSASAAPSATSVSVDSVTANASYAVGTPFIRCDVFATAQEPSGSNYGRVTVTNSLTNFPNATTGVTPAVKTNGQPITWGVPSGTWGWVAGVLFGDSPTPGSGNIWWYGMLSAPVDIQVSSGAPSISIGQLAVSQV